MDEYTTAEYLQSLQADKNDLVNNLEAQGISGLTGDETFTELVPKVLDISTGGGADLSDYFTSSITHTQIGTYTPSGIVGSLKKVPPMTLSGTDASNLFAYMSSLTTSPQIDLSGATDLSNLFYRCTSLQEINNVIFPSGFGTGSRNMSYAFQYCTNLSGDLSSINLYSSGLQNAFNGCSSITVAPTLHLRSGAYANLYGAFTDCTALTTIPNIEYNNYIQNMGMFCYGCTNLVNVPAITSSFINANGLNDAFTNCPNLSNESLNNILAMCKSATGMSTKTLKKVGLSQAQATICEGLSNYAAFTAAGWTTGY